MKVLGIDQSYNGCAYVVFEDDIMTDFGIIRSDKSKDVFSRALYNALELCNVYSKHVPDKVSIEGLAFGMSGNVTRDLAGLLFTIVNIMSLKFPNLSYLLVPPTSVKKTACGVGSAKKEDVINATPEEVRNKFLSYGVRKTTGLADLCDAYWIGKCAL